MVLTLAQPGQVSDLRRHAALGAGARFELVLDPVLPTILAVSAAPLPALHIDGPTRLRAGDIGLFHLALAGDSPAASPEVHVALRDPKGHEIVTATGNVTLRRGAADWVVPFAVNDKPGDWTLQATDILSGAVLTSTITLTPPPP
jgi:hypothetical protein